MRRPAGFAVLAVCSGLFGTVMTLGLLEGGAPDDPMLLRAMVSVIAALALVNAEALWQVRPWAYRASRALARSVVGSIAVTAAWGLLSQPVEAFWLLVIAAICAWGLRPVLDYIRGCSVALYPAP
jgi:hypothetical protein